MRKLFIKYAILSVVLLLVGCGKESEYAKVVPVDAELVATFDCERIMKESGLFAEHASDTQKQFLETFQKNLSVGETELLERIFSNPQEAGIDWSKKIYAFVQSQTHIAAFVIPVSDAERLKASILAFWGPSIKGRKFIDDDLCSWAVSRQFQIAVTNEVCMVVTSGGAEKSQTIKELVTEWLSQPEEQSFISTDYNELLLDLDGEIGLYASMSSLPENMSIMASMAYSEDMDVNSVKYLADVSFKKGEVVAKGKILFEDSDLHEWVKNQGEVFKKLDGNSLAYLPQNTPFWFGVGLNGNDLFDRLLEHPTYGKQLQNMSLPLDIEGVIRSIDGDLSIAYPTGLFVDVKNDEILRICVGAVKTMGRFIGLDLQELAKDQYELVDENHTLSRILQKESKLQVGMKDDSFYLLTSAESTKEMSKEESLVAVPWADQVEDNLLFMAFNFRYGSELVDKYSHNRRKSKVLADYFNYISYSQTDIEKNTIILSFTDQERNVLEQLLELYILKL